MCVSVCGAQFTASPSLPSPAEDFIFVKREQEGIRTFCLIVCFFSLSCLMEIGRGDCRVPRGSFVPQPS